MSRISPLSRALALACVALATSTCLVFNADTESRIKPDAPHPTCEPDGECIESCLCPDCDRYGACYSAVAVCPPGVDPEEGGCCVVDGVCDDTAEACGCPDCQGLPECEDNLAACKGGALDGVCDLDEDCLCPECSVSVRCAIASCDPAPGCQNIEACICPDCLIDGVCPTGDGCWITSPGTCDPLNETCRCPDCAGVSPCAELVAACDGGALDGACPASESCTCPECATEPRCN